MTQEFPAGRSLPEGGIKHARIGRSLMRAAMAAAAAAIVMPAQVQISAAAAAPANWAPASYVGSTYRPYPFPAPTPEDAYREGLINRWELEQFVGPLPQALQGPSANGNEGGDNGGGRQ